MKTTRPGGLSRSRWAALLLCFLAAATGTDARGDSCANSYSEISASSAIDTIRLNGIYGDRAPCISCLSTAASAWSSACGSSSLPNLTTSGAADMVVPVYFLLGQNPGTVPGCSGTKCACTRLTFSGGQIATAQIYIWEATGGGQNCTAQQTAVLTHEIGHLLGLEDPSPGTCTTRIMGNVTGAIAAADCNEVDGNFYMSWEGGVPNDHDCVWREY